MNTTLLKLYVGEEAFTLLKNERFQSGWGELYILCSWATVFQSQAFVNNWYTIYRDIYLPIIVTETYEGRLTGLLTLAKKGKIIRCAGADLAEYSVWLTGENNKDSFICSALLAVKKRFPQFPIYFKYIPGSVSMTWVQEGIWQKHCVVKSCKQPILKLDNDVVKRQRRRKYEINRIKRVGDFVFERIFEYHRFEKLLDEMIIFHDFRKGALYNKQLFQQDPNRKIFLLELFKQQLLHVVVMKLNGEIVSAGIAIIENKRIYFKGILCHSPFYSKYSPGIVSIYLTINLLAQQGFEEIDISPGDEAYKDELASHYGVVYILSVGNSVARKSTNISGHFNEYLKRLTGNWIAQKRVKHERLRKHKLQVMFLIDKIKNIKNQNAATLLNMLINKAIVGKKIKKYISKLEVTNESTVQFSHINKNSLRDLLAFRSKGTLMSQWQFLQKAQRRLEAGETVFTWCEKGVLMGCAFLNVNATSETGSVQLSGFYFHPNSQSRIQAFLKAIVDEVRKEQDSKPLFVVATARDIKLQRHLKKAGFREAV